MPLVSAAILPHGTAVIPGFSEGGVDFSAVRRGMKSASMVIAATRPQTVVIASPHNLRIQGNISVVRSEHCSGSLEEGNKRLTMSWRSDLGLAASLFDLARGRGLPVVSVNYGASGGRESTMPLDWGSLVPLWFLPRRIRIVLVTPSREIPWSDLVSFGECVAEAARLAPVKVSFVASADQGHSHTPSGPYGFNPAADEYDLKVVAMVKSGKLDGLLRLPSELVEGAKADSFWQMLILLGALKGTGMKASCCSYGCPTYYGMLSAAFS